MWIVGSGCLVTFVLLFAIGISVAYCKAKLPGANNIAKKFCVYVFVSAVYSLFSWAGFLFLLLSLFAVAVGFLWNYLERNGWNMGEGW